MDLGYIAGLILCGCAIIAALVALGLACEWLLRHRDDED